MITVAVKEIDNILGYTFRQNYKTLNLHYEEMTPVFVRNMNISLYVSSLYQMNNTIYKYIILSLIKPPTSYSTKATKINKQMDQYIILRQTYIRPVKTNIQRHLNKKPF